MADITNLSSFLEDVADAIRAKTGKTGTLQAKNFDTEIANITTGTPHEIFNTDAATISEDEDVVKASSDTITESVFIPESGSVVMSMDKERLANGIGLTADKILIGERVLDIDGTAKSGVMTQEEYDSAVSDMQYILGLSDTTYLYRNGMWADGYTGTGMYLDGSTVYTYSDEGMIHWHGEGEGVLGCMYGIIMTPIINFANVKKVIITLHSYASTGETYGASSCGVVVYDTDTPTASSPHVYLGSIYIDREPGDIVFTLSDIDAAKDLTSGYLGIICTASATDGVTDLKISEISMICGGDA